MNNEKQLPVQVINHIEKLNEHQLRYLNHIIVERLKLMNSAKALQALSKFNIGDVDSGVVIIKIDKESPAGEANLKTGDVILEIDSEPVKKDLDS